MAEVKSGWKSSEVQAGVGGAITTLLVTAMVVYFGVSTEQAVTIASGLFTAGLLIFKTIEARRSVKESAAKVEVARIVTEAPPAVPPPPAPADPKAWVDVPPAMLITPKPDPYGREGDLERS